MRRAAALGLVLAGCAAGCAEPWAPPGLAPHRATLAGHAHRLHDATPYLLPVRGELVSFFCRWDVTRPLTVRLPADATPHESRALEAALSAWEGAGLGVRFERRPAADPRPADVAFRFLAHDATSRAGGTGYTLADCRLDSLAPSALERPRLTARLARARIRIVRRETTEWTEADHAWFAGELAGVALHELAHALGFQGHARFGGGLLDRDTRESTPVGRAVLAGRPFAEPTLAALYALPSGVVLERVAVPRVRTAALDDWIAEPPGVDGPFVRVGDRTARIFWRRADGRERGVTLASVATARAHPERLVLLPDTGPR